MCGTSGYIQAVRYSDAMDYRTPDNADAPPIDLKLIVFGAADEAFRFSFMSLLD